MRFKYYLKGLGMGIIVATIILSISCVIHNNNLSDQEIIEKAMKLGMIMPESQIEDSSEAMSEAENSQTEDENNKKVDKT